MGEWGRKKQLLSGATALILNSVNEAFGVTLVEALASGTPVIGRDSGNIPHIVTDGEHGIIYNEGHLIDAVQTMADSKDLFDEQVLKERAQEYDSSKSVAKMRAILSDLEN